MNIANSLAELLPVTRSSVPFQMLGLLLSASFLMAESPNKHSLLNPFRFGGNDGLNNLVQIPPMGSAITYGKDAILVEVSTEIIANDFLDVQGNTFILNEAKTIESRARFTWGAMESLDLAVDFSFTDYSGSITALVNDEPIFHENASADREVTDPSLEAKLQLWGGQREGTGLALRAALKFPLGDDRDVHSTGSFDFSLGALATCDLDWGVWHANINYTFVGEQKIFRDQANIDLQDTVSFGLGYMFEIVPNRWAAGIQLFGYTNPFRDVAGELDSFDGIPISALAGIRWYAFRHFFLELGAGPGLTSDAADYLVFFNLAYQR